MSITKIATVTVGAGGAANISFTSIPQTFSDLMVASSIKDNRSGTNLTDDVVIEFNGSTSSYTSRVLYGGSGGSGSFTETKAFAAYATSQDATANTFGNSMALISNYAGSSYKSICADMVPESNSPSNIYLGISTGLWSNTAPITSILLRPLNGTSFAQGSSATLYGIKDMSKSAKATGGMITSDANYIYHTFTASGTFTPAAALTADVLVVAGGGAGGQSYGAGGGAGGVTFLSAQSISSAQTITVGAGGVNNSSSGSNTSFGATTATGGGLGGANGRPNGASGGSGGGGGYTPSGTIIGSGGAGTAGQGNNGGNAAGTGNSFMGLGGGGGAGGAGAPGSGGVGGAGGAGTSAYSAIAIATGTGTNVGGVYYYAGGGSGNGTGGASAPNPGGTAWNAAGATNTGSGGGGDSGLNGGSGVVIVRYPK